MNDVFKRIRARSRELAKNPLFTRWLEDDSIATKDKFLFTPMAIDFIMGFRDFNKYFIIYPEPSGPLEEALNAHALEDATHSELLLKDWAALGMDDALGWKPRDLYWWMTSDETIASRRADFELISMAYHNPEPHLRFAIIESMEAAGNVFFTRTVKPAEELAKSLGTELPYYGKYHLDRETGHLQNADERLFFKEKISDEANQRGLLLVDRVFDIFETHFNLWEKHAREVYEKRWDFRASVQGRASAHLRPTSPLDVRACLRLHYPPGLTGVNRELFDYRQQAFDQLWDTPFYTWVRQTWPGEFRRLVRYYFLQWVVDNWACADYFAFDTTYPDPKTPLERGINRLSVLYAAEMNRRYVEWELYQLDEFTDWKASEALHHYWLEPRVEEQREVFADLRKLTFKHKEPLYRYWIMKCFGEFGEALAHSMGVAMKRSNERNEDFVTLAGFPERLHPDLPPDPEADSAIAALEQQPLTEEDVAIIRSIIDATRDQEAARSRISWAIVQEKRYDALDRRFARLRSGTAGQEASVSP